LHNILLDILNNATGINSDRVDGVMS